MHTQPTIVWDFNGTLLYDIEACVNALNAILKTHHIQPIDIDYYRQHFGFPAVNFYRHLGMNITEPYDWDALAESFHMRYIFSKTLSLQPGAMQCIQTFHQQGYTQGVLSALEQDLLDLQMEQFGLARPMQFICGSRNYDGATKLDTAQRLKLKAPVIMIGDTLHDAEVATAMGWQCILCSNGHQTHARLQAAKVPIIPSLVELPKILQQLTF